jgi:hypothetical protein
MPVVVVVFVIVGVIHHQCLWLLGKKETLCWKTTSIKMLGLSIFLLYMECCISFSYDVGRKEEWVICIENYSNSESPLAVINNVLVYKGNYMVFY